MIIRDRDRLDGIISASKIPPQNPTAAVQSFAIAKMQPDIDRAPIRLAGMLELCPRGGTVQTLFSNRPRHGENSIWPIKANIASYSLAHKHKVMESQDMEYQ